MTMNKFLYYFNLFFLGLAILLETLSDFKFIVTTNNYHDDVAFFAAFSALFGLWASKEKKGREN